MNLSHEQASRLLETHQVRVDLLREITEAGGPHSPGFYDWWQLARKTKARLEALAFGGSR